MHSAEDLIWLRFSLSDVQSDMKSDSCFVVMTIFLLDYTRLGPRPHKKRRPLEAPRRLFHFSNIRSLKKIDPSPPSEHKAVRYSEDFQKSYLGAVLHSYDRDGA